MVHTQRTSGTSDTGGVVILKYIGACSDADAASISRPVGSRSGVQASGFNTALVKTGVLGSVSARVGCARRMWSRSVVVVVMGG